jgi:hypothetical protein
MSDKLGFTFYPKDWWTSDTFFELEPIERYIYLESLFLMYQNEGLMKTQKTQLERRISLDITEQQWKNVTKKFIIDNGMFTDPSVNKRLRKAIANRENGKKGGRPLNEEKPKEPNLETQNNPPLEREYKEKEKYKNKEDIYIDDILMSKLKSSDFTQGSLEENYFKIVNAFIKVFKENKKELGDSNMTHLNNAKFKPYVEPIRLLMEVDKYKKEDIKIVYDFLKSKESEFWKPNILSTTSLRKKFSKLLIEAKRPKTNYKTQDLDQIEM